LAFGYNRIKKYQVKLASILFWADPEQEKNRVTYDVNDPLKNHLLAALPEEDFRAIEPHLKMVKLELGTVLYESGDALDSLYFPTSCIVSLLYVMENGATAEIGVVGNDGVLGVALFMGGGTTTNRAVVQSSGTACTMAVREVMAEFAKGGRFQGLLLRYTQALITQISQTAVCNRLHSVEQQLCRWLLLSHDRLDNDELVMTHDLISNMLGVRREGVTLAAQKLAAKKLIKNVRGTIMIIDRQGLEDAVCECYDVVNKEYNRLLDRGVSRRFQ
jgi:CRP-like cAMP-binding protein